MSDDELTTEVAANNEELTASTVCPECGELAIYGTQEVNETEAETCRCPNDHEWKRKIPKQGHKR